ncbi:MAG: hypothetical protein WCO00_01830 [Rhodospirillaceae bacterium]
MLVKSDPWRLLALVEEAKDGRVAAAHPVPCWTAPLVEALWDNILNDWPVGPFVLLDVSASPERPWRGRLGPYPVNAVAPRRLMIEEGAGRLAALAWSLADVPTLALHQCRAEEVALWTRQTLVLDLDQRRVRFAGTDFAPNRHLPVHLLPAAGPCLRAIGAMELRAAEREWVNLTARRLLETRCPVYVFPDTSTRLAERMLTNFRQIGSAERRAAL